MRTKCSQNQETILSPNKRKYFLDSSTQNKKIFFRFPPPPPHPIPLGISRPKQKNTC